MSYRKMSARRMNRENYPWPGRRAAKWSRALMRHLMTDPAPADERAWWARVHECERGRRRELKRQARKAARGRRAWGAA